jgi:hypothetical protein
MREEDGMGWCRSSSFDVFGSKQIAEAGGSFCGLSILSEAISAGNVLLRRFIALWSGEQCQFNGSFCNIALYIGDQAGPIININSLPQIRLGASPILFKIFLHDRRHCHFFPGEH